MTLIDHKKHAAISRPANGNFARNEWAILGGPCTVIKFLADQVISVLSPQYRCAYGDTSHSNDKVQLPGKLDAGAALDYTDQNNYSQLNYAAALDPFKQRELFAAMDIVLVNGNHQQAKAQIVIIDSNKAASLQKRLDQLTNVQLFLLADNADELPVFVKEAVADWQKIPVLRLNDDAGKITAFFKNKLEQAKPILQGLVLAGGKSTRMGYDKGSVNWYGKEQRYHMADLLKKHCADVYISCRDVEQQKAIFPDYLSLADTFIGLGPYGAILSAFREQPDKAWLVVACDLPLVDTTVLQYLVNNRNTATIATAYQSDYQNFPEPLITIYEPKSYPILLQFLAQGYSCPRKVLINSDVNVLKAPEQDALTNVNTPEELERIKRILHQKIAVKDAG
ncbi:NTP transferase domain-containing protein [Mucilaginibacter glaciei]|uniref:Probable molybdenum cofactor guanylyltransferase n=1 Tax=Mucilaginibacter glaciei TaxID=2772109 RepID=A0A926RZL6_9SPHI|nr:NTP transferase domain-containing protein [Mucilaginibacter glaciei]MBD1391990.1 NTP transferase domain-containing protein [Mucilaginibacter glaciei]